MNSLFKSACWSLFVVAICLMAAGCGEEEDPNSAIIVATWNFNAVDLDVEINDQPLVNFLMNELGMTQAEAIAEELAFKAFLLELFPFEDSTITFMQNGNFEIKENGILQESGTYTLSSNNSLLSLHFESGTEEYDVLDLNNTRLVISNGITENDDLTDDGIPEKIDLRFTLRLTK